MTKLFVVLISIALHVFNGLKRWQYSSYFYKMTHFPLLLILLFPTPNPSLLYFKYFPFTGSFFLSLYLFHLETHICTSVDRMILWLIQLFLLLAEWFSGPRQTWVQILAEWLTKCMIMGKFLYSLSLWP